MDDLLIRRRGMILLSKAPPEWDYEWKSTSGLPSSAGGWTKTGADTPSINTSGMQCKRALYSKDVAITHGVIEADLIIVNERTNMNTRRAHLRIGDSNNCIYVIFSRYNNCSINLWNYSSSNSPAQLKNGTYLGSFEWGGEYVVRITINGSTGSVEINGNTVADNINTAGMFNKGMILFGNDEQYGSSRWKYVRYKTIEEAGA